MRWWSSAARPQAGAIHHQRRFAGSGPRAWPTHEAVSTVRSALGGRATAAEGCPGGVKANEGDYTMVEQVENLGGRLRKVRLATGMSLREVARQLGVSPSFVSQLENGKSQPSVATLYSLAQLLGVSIDELFAVEGWATDPRT